MLEVLAWACAAIAVAGVLVEVSNLGLFPQIQPTAASGASVDVYVAMRDEEANAEAMLASLLAQPNVARVVIADDGSSDRTAALVEAIAIRDVRVTRIAVTSPSIGASPKAHALATAIAASPILAPYVLFLDADLRLFPGAIGGMLATIENSNVDALTAWPQVRTPSLWSTLLAPSLTLFLLQALPMRLARRNDPRFAAGNGQCFLIRREAYEGCGGHARLAAIVEDVALARALTGGGYRIGLASAALIAAVCGYDGFRDHVRGLGRSLYYGAGSAGCVAVALWQIAGFVLPALFLAMGLVPGAIGSIALFTARALAAWRMRESGIGVLLAPLAGAVTAAMALAAAWDGARGRIAWRGRALR